MEFPPGAARPFAAGDGAGDAFPVGPVARIGGPGRERAVAGKLVVRGDRGERETSLDIGIHEPVARAQAKPRQHGEALAVQALIARMVEASLEAHLPDMAGGAGGDLQRAHLGRGRDGMLHPGVG